MRRLLIAALSLIGGCALPGATMNIFNINLGGRDEPAVVLETPNDKPTKDQDGVGERGSGFIEHAVRERPPQ